MTSRVRRYLGAAVLLLAAPLASPSTPAVAAPAQACNPAPRTDASFCATYDVAVLATGTETPVTTSQSPFDLRVSFANTSGSVADGIPSWALDANLGRYVTRISATLASQGDRQPILPASTDLPNGLLVAGSAAGCEPGADSSFSACTAGRGTAWLKVARVGSKELKATFGIERIFHNRTLATSGGHHAVLQADISYCIDTNGGAMTCDQKQKLSRAVAVEKPAPGRTVQLPFELPLPEKWGIIPLDVTPQAIGLDSAVINYRGLSDQLTTGPASGEFTVWKLPMRCGVADLSGTATSVAAGAVIVAKSLEVTRCSQIMNVKAPGSVIAGKAATITGVVQDWDTKKVLKFASIRLYQCTTATTAPCGVSTGASLTEKDGSFTFTAKPTFNMHYYVRVQPTNGNPEQWVMRRINVAPKVVLTASRARMASGGSVTLSGLVKPAHKGDELTLQRKSGNAWVTLTTTTLDDSSAFSVTTTLTGASGTKAKLRAILPAHSDHIQGTSPKVVVTFR